MGVFDNMPGMPGSGAAGGDWAKQAADAQAAADEMLKSAGYTTGAAGASSMDVGQMGTDRAAIEAQANEQNRILTVGSPATLTIVSAVDTGEMAGGNPIYTIKLKVEPAGGSAYTVTRREIVSTAALSGYTAGTTMPGRIDPADKNLVAFGDKPFR